MGKMYISCLAWEIIYGMIALNTLEQVLYHSTMICTLLKHYGSSYHLKVLFFDWGGYNLARILHATIAHHL